MFRKENQQMAEDGLAESGRQIPQGIQEAFRRWRRLAAWLRVVHVFLLVSASVFSILTASKLASERTAPVFGVLAALSVGILTALDLGVKANGLRNAWRHMNAAIARYQSNRTFTVERLIEAYEDAENLIGDLPAGPRPSIQPPPSQQTVRGEQLSSVSEFKKADVK